MIDIDVDSLKFSFPDGWTVHKFDDWAFYRNQLSRVRQGLKAVDLIAFQPGEGGAPNTLWLIEVKDYRQHQRTKQITLPDEVGQKALDTLSGVLPAAINANNAEEKQCAKKCLRSGCIRIVLHLEVPQRTRLLPPTLNQANVQQALRQRVKALDAHPRVVSMNSNSGIPWQVAG